MTISDFSIDDTVLFGRGRGEQTRGTVVGKGRTKLKVRQDETRGQTRLRPVGTIWTVPPSMCRKVSGGDAYGRLTSIDPFAPTKTTPFAPNSQSRVFHKGEKVAFLNKGVEVVGYVKRVNPKTISVNPIGQTGGRYWRVSRNLLRKVA